MATAKVKKPEISLALQIAKEALLDPEIFELDKNFVCSPLSTTILLHLFASGSRGVLLEKFLGVLGLKNEDELAQNYLQLRDLASSDGENGGPLLLTCHGVWVHQKFTLVPSFKQVLKSLFGIDARSLNFNDKDIIADEVNTWVNEKTKGLIHGLIDNSIFRPERIIILVNAMYFKGPWVEPFNKSMTTDDEFFLLDGAKMQVPFMHKFETTHVCGCFDGFKILLLPYRAGNDDQNKRFSMYFFLSDEKDGLQKMINQLASDPLFLNKDFHIWSQTVEKLMIPKFKFRSEFSPSDAMKSLGFCPPKLTEFEMIAERLSEEEDRFMGVHQKAFVEIDEEGTIAAAVDSDDDMGFCLEQPPPVNFIADHPFLFMIKERFSQVPFFVGAVVNPLQEE